jgi:uncharacterized protein (TIGR02246 family)
MLVPAVAEGVPMNSTNHERHAARILALDEAWKAAAARRDLDGMMAVYARDARELLPDMPAIVGRDAIRTFYGGLIGQLPRFEHRFETHEVIVAESGDLAVVYGSYRFTADAAHPNDVQIGKFIGVWRYRNGDWQLQMNISNNDQPA